MGKRKVKIKDLWETLCDRCKFAMVGTFELLKRPKYLAAFIISLVVFLFVLSFFKDGDSNWVLLTSGLDFGRKMQVLGRVFVSIFENFTSLYGIIITLMAILQAAIIPLLIYTWKQRARDQKNKDQAIDGASTGSIGAILGFIALGCPTCGVGLLTPILAAIAGASALALAEAVGHIFTIVAFILLFYTIIKLGYITFINLSNEKYKKKEHHAKSN